MRTVPLICGYSRLELRTCCYECLAGLVSFVLLEVLDEALCKILCLCLPLCRICISVTRIEDLGSYTRKRGRNLEVKERNLLGLGLVD